MSQQMQALVLTDLGFGDAGKGALTDFLTRQCAAHTIVRYNGGPQAAHNVLDARGRHHTFSQFTSGMLVPGTRTLLSRFMLVNPLNMLKEARHLNELGVLGALQRVLIDRRALLITPFQRAINRLREIARADKRHGSCGEGIGECMADYLAYQQEVLFAGDSADRPTLLRKLRFLRDAKYQEFRELAGALPTTEAARQEASVFTDPGCLDACLDVYHYFAQCVELIDETSIRALFARPGTLLFEGAQGVLLDENYGFAPYTTWSTTTCANAQTLLQEYAYAGQVQTIGLLRAYATRHGAGPFPTEEPALNAILPEPHNVWNNWQREFRRGYCDLVALRYAREVTGQLDYLAVTHADYLPRLPEWRVCTAYRYQGAARELSACFQHQDEIITALRVQRPPDLAHQEQLTGLLQRCTPIYQHLDPADQDAYFALIEEQLGTPVGIISHGPTAQEKTWSANFARQCGMPLDALRTIA